MKRLQALFVAVVIGSIWVSPACKSNEVNQEEVTNNNYKSVVGPAGATFEIPEGVKIRIPAGAVDEEVEVSITEAKAGEYPVTEGPGTDGPGSIRTWTPVGKVWAFQPHGQKFFVEATMWLPAPDGEYFVMKAQPDGRWETLPNSVKPVNGKVEFTTKSFSFYTLQKVDFGPGGDARVTTPCEACMADICLVRCAKENTTCIDQCMATDCAPACAGGSDAGSGEAGGKPDASIPGTDTSTCTPMCPSGSGGPGAPCKSCGGAMGCTVSSGSTTWDCTCDPSDTLTACSPRTGGSDAAIDTAVGDSGDAGMCGGCPPTTVPLRPGDGTSPCCKLFPSEADCAAAGAGSFTNTCTAGKWICRTGGSSCL